MIPATAIAIAFFYPAPARGDTTERLLDQLRTKGILTKSEYQELKRRHAAELAQHAVQQAVAKSDGPASKGDKPSAAPYDRFVTRADKGIGVRIGDVDVGLQGQLVFFGAEQFKQRGGNVAVGGGLSGGSTINNSASIRSGLLPSSLVLNIATVQSGYNIGFTLGLYTGGNNVNVGLLNGNSSGTSVAMGTPGADVRQVFGTIGTPDIGTVKIGRDIGLFGSDAILNDFTLFGTGTIAGNASPANTSLGRIGFGYVYADWIPQVSYTSPNFYGVTFSVGAFSPYQEFNNAGSFESPWGAAPYSGTLTGHDQPGFQARVKYVGRLAPDVKLTAWTDGLTQQHRVEADDAVLLPRGAAVRAWAVDGGARLDFGPATFVAYGYYGVGLGTTALYFDGVSIDGERRASSGFYAEAAYTLFERLTIGGSYGVSYLHANAIDYPRYHGDGTLVASNASAIGFVRYQFSDWVTLQSEYIHSVSHNLIGEGISSDALVLGTTFTF
ncbi:hypothetical protein [Methylocapsa acidiphila]|uniref:hypothetical protein n=1 Tax=Methylocapsa acidiphila TaxID=133552 RepID=UPI000685C3AA|nr:hypothetical protein [Methylocapsa acidiphila]